MVDFATFFVIWAELKGWEVPAFHLRVCDWLENRGNVAVLQIFRGAAKSTITAVYEAWRLYSNPQTRFLVQASDEKLAIKMSRDCREVLQNHPLTIGLLSGRVAEHMFWVHGSNDQRNASVSAYGVLSNVTGSRADEVIFDDVEVPNTIASADLRDKLRGRVSEATYILVPGGKKLFIGTPHTFDSIYEEVKAKGADSLFIPLFERNQREERESATGSIELDASHFDDVHVFKGDELLTELHYTIEDGCLIFKQPISGLIDIYSGNAWPERFTREEVRNRRKEARSLNEWDSQYMLRARPVTEMRLNPEKLRWYDALPEYSTANGVNRCMIGGAKMASVRAYWDVAAGKVGGDGSVLSIVFADEVGNLYWQACIELMGEIEEQCNAVRQAVERYSLPAVAVETNGIGGFVPALLRKALRGMPCAVIDATAKGNKNERIIAAIEGQLSASCLWAHVSVGDTAACDQMAMFNPLTRSNKDDCIDSLAGAILAQPVRIAGSRLKIEQHGTASAWAKQSKAKIVSSYRGK